MNRWKNLIVTTTALVAAATATPHLGAVAATGSHTSDSAQGAVWNKAASGTRYVAIGDSAAAGPVIFPQRFPQPFGCFRSKVNFPSLVAEQILATAFNDVTCSSATTANMTQPQNSAPPQLDALSPATTVVTLGPLGANDSGLVTSILSCLLPGCATRLGTGPIEDIDAVRPQLVATVQEIRRRAPNAALVLVGYGKYLPDGGCPGIQPLNRTDADYVQSITNYMSDTLASVAQQEGAEFADLRTTPGAASHTACDPWGQRWFEGINPIIGLDGAIAFHPTAAGMRAFAAPVTAAVRRAQRAQLPAN